VTKYDLAQMLAEIRDDERVGKADEQQQKKILTQDEIREMARKRRRKGPAGKPQA
jgi:hypothetical protein